MREASGEMETLLGLDLPVFQECLQMKRFIKLCIEYICTLSHVSYISIEILMKETKL